MNPGSFESLPERFQSIVIRLAQQTHCLWKSFEKEGDKESQKIIEELAKLETNEEKKQEPYLVLLLLKQSDTNPALKELIHWQQGWIKTVGVILRNEDRDRNWLARALTKV